MTFLDLDEFNAFLKATLRQHPVIREHEHIPDLANLKIRKKKSKVKLKNPVHQLRQRS